MRQCAFAQCTRIIPIEREAHRSPSSSRVKYRSHMSLFSPRQPIHNIFLQTVLPHLQFGI